MVTTNMMFFSLWTFFSCSVSFRLNCPICFPLRALKYQVGRFDYLIRTNFRGHLISRIWNTNISRALIFAILQKMINLGHLISRKLTKDRLTKLFFLLIDQLNNDWSTIMICNYVKEIALIIRQNKQILQINQMLLQYCTNKSQL